MRAKDYFDKYASALRDAQDDPAGLYEIAKRIYVDFQSDLNDLISRRHITMLGSAADTILEQNAKWNALARLIEKEIGTPVLKQNGFRNAKAEQVPELAEIYRARGLAVGEGEQHES